MNALSGCFIIGPDGKKYRLVSDSPEVVENISVLNKLEFKELGNKIKSLRTYKGYSQRALARKAGMTHAQLNRIETGKVKKPHASILKALADLLF